MTKWVVKNDVKYPCKTEEQYKLFKDAGYVDVVEKEEKKPEKKAKK